MRINQQITTRNVRVVNSNGDQLGIMETSGALEIAKEQGLDLVEVAHQVSPPVCKIMDYGKFQYQKSKQAKERKAKQGKIETKTVKIGFKTGQHDLGTKARKAIEFLDKGYKVNVEIFLKGRERSEKMESLAKEKVVIFVGMTGKIRKEQMQKLPRGFGMVITRTE